MTFEEAQKIIDEILAMQKKMREMDLQHEESQQKWGESLPEIRVSLASQKIFLQKLSRKYGNLSDSFAHQKEIMDRLIQCQLKNQSDPLDLEERLQVLEETRQRIERDRSNNS